MREAPSSPPAYRGGRVIRTDALCLPSRVMAKSTSRTPRTIQILMRIRAAALRRFVPHARRGSRKRPDPPLPATGRDLPRPAGRPVMTKTILAKQQRLDSSLPNSICFRMLQRTLPAGFIAPCLPTSQWLHEIKHDGFRIIARKKGAQVRLYSRPATTSLVVSRSSSRHWLAYVRAPALSMARLSRAMTTALRRLIWSVTTAPTAFDLIERNGDDDLRRVPPEVRKTTLASIVANSALKALCQSARIPPTVPAARPIGSK
jgi:hypothetical protein